jgi:copper chaperone CopZ
MDENCYVKPIHKDTYSSEQLQNADQATMIVWGMGCENCATRVRNSILSLEGVYSVEVFLNMAMAEVIYDPEKTLPKELVAAVARAGNDGHHEYRAQLVAME